MVLKNLFAGQQLRKRHREQSYGHGERGRCRERVTWKLTSPYIKREPTGICCEAQETQTGALHQLRGMGWGGMGGRLKREGVYVHLWLIHVEV